MLIIQIECGNTKKKKTEYEQTAIKFVTYNTYSCSLSKCIS